MYRKTLLITVILILVISSAGLFGCSSQLNTVPATTPTVSSPPTVTSPPTPTTPGQLELPTIAGVVAKVKPSVVAITEQITTYNVFNQPVQGTGAGSGWIIRSDGYIVTNNHVVEGATNITVTMDNGQTFPADKVYTDAVTDLAIIKINAQNLPALSPGDSQKLNVGDWVVAIGNALGQGISATKGIVSAMGISLSESPGQTLNNLIQTDAAINPGNSGGPLVDLAGEVIGINSLKISQVGVEGMGYAISIDEALPIIETLISTGYISRPWLGISVYAVGPMIAAFYNLSVDKGVLITDVTAGSPADKAGLVPGDVITAVDGKEQTDDGAFMQLINSLKIGQKIEITYYHGKTQKTVEVTLGQSPKS